MALSFTEGSIGGDIESVDLDRLKQLYPSSAAGAAAPPHPGSSSGGSNGFAIAPSRSASGHALLWINPHTSFYFRSELQMVSEQGLNVYGAVTWGQFFVYQGFNARNGWMHTSYGGDAIDEYAESIERSAAAASITDMEPACRKAALRAEISDSVPNRGTVRTSLSFTVYHSHHGPIVRAETASGLRSNYSKTRCARWSNRTCAPRPRLRVVPQDAGHAHRHFQQHGVRRCRRHHRLLSRQFHSEARSALRLHAPGRRQQPGDRMARRPPPR
jgi:acyl-homoserine lactone acylase PvdQ